MKLKKDSDGDYVIDADFSDPAEKTNADLPSGEVALRQVIFLERFTIIF